MGVDRLSRVAAVFLDRDGVINRNVLNPATGAWESPLQPEQVEIIPEVLPAMRRLREAGYLLFVVSNQPNYAKAKSSLETLEAIHQRVEQAIVDAGIEIASFYYCFHHPEGLVPEYSGPCQCRKPSPYFLLQARDRFDLDMGRSWMVGDRPSDMECGRRAGVRTIRIVNVDEGAQERGTAADFVADGLAAAVAIIMGSQTAAERP
jgi:D-glycero-D-manno-heptose 1,7-bisphosphate phosphatase